MKIFGFLIVVGSLILGFNALNMDISIESGMGNRIANLSLMNQQQNFIYISGVLLIVGLILLLRKKETIIKSEEQKNSKVEFEEIITEKGFNYKLPIKDNVTFERIKQETLSYYENKGFLNTKNDETGLFIKNWETKAYVEVKNRNTYISVSIYNTIKPDFINSLYSNIEKTTDIIELSKLLNKGLITEDEFISYKNKLQN